MDDPLVDCFLVAFDNPPGMIVAGIDATDYPTHGNHEGLILPR